MNDNDEILLSSIYGDVKICTKEEAEKMKRLKMAESEIFSQFTMDYSKKFSAWW